MTQNRSRPEAAPTAGFPVGAASGREPPRVFRGGNLRKGRVSELGQAYLLTSVTHQRQPLFLDWPSASPLISALRHADVSGQANTLAYVVMPDHFHWLMQLDGKATLSGLMRGIKTWSAREINRQRQLGGLPRLETIWQHGFHDHAVRTEEDVRQLARYVVANPLRAGLVADLGDYSLWDAIWLVGSRPEAAPTAVLEP